MRVCRTSGGSPGAVATELGTASRPWIVGRFEVVAGRPGGHEGRHADHADVARLSPLIHLLGRYHFTDPGPQNDHLQANARPQHRR